jgi:hypothetical protein
VLLKKNVTIIVLLVSFAFLGSLMMENVHAATPAIPEPTTSVESALPANSTYTFAYATIGTESSKVIAPKTYNLCNYTTPPNIGIIVQISIYLIGVPEGSQVNAVIFANEPDAKFPQDADPIAQSSDTQKVTSTLGEWYNFTMNYPAHPNTVYWLGYFSDNSTQYFFNADNNHISVTSQTKDNNSQWLPIGWSYQGKSIMSLYALYTAAEPQPSATTAHLSSNAVESTSIQDVFFVLVLMGAESVVVVTDKNRKNKNNIDKKTPFVTNI